MDSFEALKKIGLSKTSIETYMALLNSGTMRVSQLAKILSLAPSGLYRVINDLESMGFIVELGDYPKRYQARSIDDALDHYLSYQNGLVEKLREKTTGKAEPTPKMQVLTGRKEIFDTYMKLARKAKQDLPVISIGEKVPEELYQIVRKRVMKGVKSYLIFQKHDEENDIWLKRWEAFGSKVRLKPGTGYHLNIIDNNYAILSASNPKNTKERSAVLITSSSIVIELRKYFFQQWQEAKPLGPLEK